MLVGKPLDHSEELEPPQAAKSCLLLFLDLQNLAFDLGFTLCGFIMRLWEFDRAGRRRISTI
jgi:hypothetical protein